MVPTVLQFSFNNVGAYQLSLQLNTIFEKIGLDRRTSEKFCVFGRAWAGVRRTRRVNHTREEARKHDFLLVKWWLKA